MIDTASKWSAAVVLAATALLAAGCERHAEVDVGRPLQMASASIAAKIGESAIGTDQSVEDSNLTTLVSKAISADTQLQSQDIVVDIDDGAVTLSGVVDSPSLRKRAVELAGLVDGVAQVQDKLEVRN